MKANSKIGFHTAVGGNKNGLGGWEKQLNAAGIPFFIKSADEYGILLEALAIGDEYGVDNWLVYRVVLSKPNDVPNYYIDPRDAADEYWQRIVGIDRFPPEFDKSRVWLDVLNEPRAQEDADSPNWEGMHPVAWLGAFSCRIGEIALQNGYKVCLPSFNSGEPNENDYEHEEWLDFMRMCGEYPDSVALSVHEYAWNLWENDPNPANWYPHLWGRMENFIAACDLNGISRDITIFGTEFGWGHDGHTIPPVSQGMDFLRWYDEWAARWPQLKGVALWSLQSDWAEIADAVQPYIAPLTAYQLANDFEMGEQPSMTYLGTLPDDIIEPPTDGTTAEKLFTLSQVWAFPVNEDAALQKVALADGFTPSGEERWETVDGAQYAVQPFYKIGDTNVKRSYYAIVGAWGDVWWTDGEEPTPPVSGIILPIPFMSQNGEGATARRNDCGAACVAMIVNGMTSNAPTVDDVAIGFQDPANSYMSFSQLDAALNGYDMDGQHQRPFYADGIEARVRQGEAVIALVWYQSLPHKYSTFNGSHFIVVYGVDGDGLLMYHDPLASYAADLLIAPVTLNKAMADVTNGGNMASQAMYTFIKDAPVIPPPTGEDVQTSPYFNPVGDVGTQVVFHFDNGETQPQQMIRQANGRVVMFKGEGQWIDDKLYQDYEEWQTDNDGVHKYVDTSDAGHGGLDAYDLGGEIWLPATVRVGGVYVSAPTVRRFNRSNCEDYENEVTTDYLYIREIIPHWISPKNAAISFDDVLVVEWRKAADTDTPAAEVYKFAAGVGYVEWGGEGRIGAAIGELPEGRAPLGGALSSC